MRSKIVGWIVDVEGIAAGTAIGERKRLGKNYGKRRWRNLEAEGRCKGSDSSMKRFLPGEDSLARSSWDRRETVQDQADRRVTPERA